VGRRVVFPVHVQSNVVARASRACDRVTEDDRLFCLDRSHIPPPPASRHAASGRPPAMERWPSLHASETDEEETTRETRDAVGAVPGVHQGANKHRGITRMLSTVSSGRRRCYIYHASNRDVRAESATSTRADVGSGHLFRLRAHSRPGRAPLLTKLPANRSKGAPLASAPSVPATTHACFVIFFSLFPSGTRRQIGHNSGVAVAAVGEPAGRRRGG